MSTTIVESECEALPLINDPNEPLRRLTETFGFSDFRPGQEEAVNAALTGRDVLVVMPTGAGKSLCYQLPALMRNDLAVVVSPLVSLMQDQVETLEQVAPGRIGVINAQQSSRDNWLTLNRLQSGEIKILYVAPERFGSSNFRDAIKSVKVGLFVVDEAHCVSEWGHDFRPDYFRLGDAARWLEADTLMAVTATATPLVTSEIARRLGLEEPVRVVTGFDRPNLSFGVIECASKEHSQAAIAQTLKEPGSLPAIVYSGTRSRTERLAESLSQALNIEVLSYHAGLSPETRARAQRRFMGGDVQLVVATNAFGMGVDKADVRTVCHDGAPGSLEAYYQEAGRAGRDRKPSRCLLFTCKRDKGLHVFFIERSEVKDKSLTRAAECLIKTAVDGRYALSASELAQSADCDEEQLRSIIGHLIHAGVIKPSPAGVDQVAGQIIGEWDKRARMVGMQSAQAGTKARWRQYRTVWKWIEGGRCRREGFLRHFGDTSRSQPEVLCCDVCDSELTKSLIGTARGRRKDVMLTGASPDVSAGGSQTTERGAVPRTGLVAEGADPSLGDAIVGLVQLARPGVGRTRAVEVLRGGRSKVIVKYSYDGLPQYGLFSQMPKADVLAKVDELLDAGVLKSTGGHFPKLELSTDSARVSNRSSLQHSPLDQNRSPALENELTKNKHPGAEGNSEAPFSLNDREVCDPKNLLINPDQDNGLIVGSERIDNASVDTEPQTSPKENSGGQIFRVGVLVSGEGTNLQAIIDRLHGREGIQVVAVGSDRADAKALTRAENAGISVASFLLDKYENSVKRDHAMANWFNQEYSVDLVVLAGYMRLLSPEFLNQFFGKVINIHPSLLPAFPGTRAIEEAFDYGVKIIGATVHFVDEGIDTGPIILQRALDVQQDQNCADLRSALRPVEHDLLCEAIRVIAQGRVRFDQENPRRVLIDQRDGV